MRKPSNKIEETKLHTIEKLVGVYQCFASNGVSMSSQWAELTVTGPEVAAPVALQCAPTGPTSVVLSWRTLDEVTGYYIVQWEPTG